VSSTVGVIAPYVLLGKVAKSGTAAFAERQGITGLAGLCCAAIKVANVGAAGVYEVLKKPQRAKPGRQQRSTMLSFSAYEAGNYGLRKATPLLDSKLGKAALTISGTRCDWRCRGRTLI